MSNARITDLEGWLRAMAQPAALMELGALLLCAGLAWVLAVLLQRGLGPSNKASITFGKRIVDGVLFPTLLLCLAYAAKFLLSLWMVMALFKLAIPVLIALLMVRFGVKVLQAAFKETPMVRTLERSISWLAWLAMVLWVSGLLPLVLEELDSITWKVGGSVVSLRSMIEGGLTACVVLIISLWISSALEARLLRSATGGELSLRMAISNATRALLMFIGLLVALSSVGINLSALSVLGGALGVGVGFGLQKLAANYVSGFVILAERSMRIGDNVKVDNFEGRITQINARYTVIRSLTGSESIVPNELLVSNRVENLSLADAQVWHSTVVSVGYESDVDLVISLLRAATVLHERVLQDPAPSVNLSKFGADGLEFTVGYWLADPENGSMNLKSMINLAILKSLREHQVDIPYPQRVVHSRAA